MTAVTGLLMSMAIAGALLAVSLKNVLHAIFGLAISLLAIAGLFVVLNSPFVAAMEVLIYVGGISVAMVFAVMLSTVVPKHAAETPLRRGIAALIAVVFMLGVGAVVVGADLAGVMPRAVPEELWSVAHLGRWLLDDYNLVFEGLSVVLLLAILGAIVISRRDQEESP
jgi:NADH:ubiquinone oxidoreductase subunit 6 (subunit J)